MLVGVDEAGRGPVLGPLVVGICMVPNDDEALLEKQGVKDSKFLSPRRRQELHDWFQHTASERGWFGGTVEFTAHDIDMALQNDGLNWLEVRGFQQALELLPSKDYLEVILDACDVNAQRFANRVCQGLAEWPWHGASVVAEHKADSNHLVVAMASIIAKHERDRRVEEIGHRAGFPVGSGYPSDPTTKAALPMLCLQEGIDVDVRWSWATVERFWKNNRTGDVPHRGQPRTTQSSLF